MAQLEIVTAGRHYKGTAAVRREFLKDTRPASTGVIVAGLLRPEALIETAAVAVLRG